MFTATNVRDITTVDQQPTARRAPPSATTSSGSTTARARRPPRCSRGRGNALAKLEARLGPYPYRILKIVQSAGGYGMEGPGVAWIPTGVGSSNLTYLVTHEVAHQWFYGIVGNDQAREPFADEAMTDFVARYVLGMRRASRCATAPLDRSIYRYGYDLLLRAGLHPGRQPHRQCAQEDGLDRVLGSRPRLHLGPPLGPVAHEDAAQRARRRDVAQPRLVVGIAVPHAVLRKDTDARWVTPTA